MLFRVYCPATIFSHFKAIYMQHNAIKYLKLRNSNVLFCKHMYNVAL